MKALDNISESLGHLWPEILLLSGLLLILVFGLIPNRKNASLLGGAILVVLSVSLLSFQQINDGSIFNLFIGDLHLSPSVVWFKVIIDLIVVGVFVFQLSLKQDVELEKILLLLSGLLGAHFALMSTDLLVLYLSVELLSLSLYGLVYLSKTKESAEGAIKYLVYGVVVSGVTAYGISVIYMFVGDLAYDEILLSSASSSPTVFFQVGVFMAVSGLLFKLGAAPFHFWVPDVYKASDEPVLVYLSLVPKFVGVGALLYFIQFAGLTAFPWMRMLDVVILLSLVIGTTAALLQTSFKKMMAFSSIAQAGFLLMAMEPILFETEGAHMSLSFYMVMLSISTFAAFIASSQLQLDSYTDIRVGNTKLMIQKICLGAAMVSFVGIPPAIGFSAKFNVFTIYYATVEGLFTEWHAVILSMAFLATVISMVFYLKPVYHLLVKKQINKIEINVSYEGKILLVLVTVPLLLGFVFWGQLLEMLRIFTSI